MTNKYITDKQFKEFHKLRELKKACVDLMSEYEGSGPDVVKVRKAWERIKELVK